MALKEREYCGCCGASIEENCGCCDRRSEGWHVCDFCKQEELLLEIEEEGYISTGRVIQ